MPEILRSVLEYYAACVISTYIFEMGMFFACYRIYFLRALTKIQIIMGFIAPSANFLSLNPLK